MKRNYNQIIRFADIHSKTDTIHRYRGRRSDRSKSTNGFPMRRFRASFRQPFQPRLRFTSRTRAIYRTIYVSRFCVRWFCAWKQNAATYSRIGYSWHALHRKTDTADRHRHRHRHRQRHRRRHRRFSSNKGGKSASNHSKPREEHNETVRETTIPFMFDLARLAVYGGNRCTLGDEPSGFPDGFFYNQLSLDRAYRWLCCSWDTFSDRYWQDNGVLCGAVIKTRGRAERGRTRGGSGCSFLFARASQGIMREKERKRERRTWWTRQRRERQLQEQRER